MASYATDTPRRSDDYLQRNAALTNGNQNEDLIHSPRSRNQQSSNNQNGESVGYNGFMSQRIGLENNDQSNSYRNGNHYNNNGRNNYQENYENNQHDSNRSLNNGYNGYGNSNQELSPHQRGLSLEYGKTIKLLRYS